MNTTPKRKLRAYAVVPFLVQTIFYWPVWLVITLFARFDVEGINNVTTISGPAIFVSNHPNQADPLFIRLALSWLSNKTPLFWMARDSKTYNWTGWRKYILNDAFYLAVGAPIAPSGLKDYAKSLKRHVQVVYDGYSFNIFPQAGYEKYHGKDAHIHGGVAYLAHATGAPIIPVAVVGTQGFNIKKLIFGRCSIRVIFGQPISVEALRLISDESVTVDEYKDVARRLMQTVHELHQTHKRVLPIHGYVPSHPDLKFETNSLLKSLAQFFVTPLLDLLPASLRETTKKTHRLAKEVVEHKTTYRALEVLYLPPNAPRERESFIKELFYTIWFSTNNSKAVRNRLKLVKLELKRACERVLRAGDQLRLLSIASGSARADIEMLKDLELPVGVRPEVTFLDKDPRSLEYSKRLAAEFGILEKYNIRWIEDTASGYVKHFTDNAPNVIEMVGLLDYFNDDKSVSLFKLIRNTLGSSGTFVTGNIVDNSERPFVTNLIGWDMVYRKAECVAELLEEAGFERDQITPYYEPMYIQSVVVAHVG
jgi:1-acyl-sn-glycerol-3-phosphate acyltransferase